mgnify:CR=1 FL=1
MNIPADLRYSSDHEWVRRDGDVVTIGITDYVNEQLDDQPELLNSDPYGDGWLCSITMTDPSQFDALLDADGYRALTEG